MNTFITRTKRDPITGMVVQVRAEIPISKEVTIDELRKEITVLKKELMRMIELESENKDLKNKLKQIEYKTSKKEQNIKPIIYEPPKELLLDVALKNPELISPRQATQFYKNDAGVWIEGIAPIRRTRRKNPTT